MLIKPLTKLFNRTIYTASHLSHTLGNKNYFLFAETSRDIEHKMRIEQLKSIQNKFKSLSTHFGLRRPQTVSKDYPTPSTIEFTMQSLRKCSHMYPDYLALELGKKNSQFHEVIEEGFNGLALVANKEAIQFLQFLISWKLNGHSEEYSQMIARKIYQMEMDLIELFSVLRFMVSMDNGRTKSNIMKDIQNKILQHIKNIEQQEYQILFKLLNFMRTHDLTPDIHSTDQVGGNSFFEVVESVLLRNLSEIPLPCLVQMVIHYANNIKEEHDHMTNILTKAEPRILQNLAFFSHDELIGIIYSYIKTNLASQQMIQQFVRRVELLYFQISWENKKRILNLSSSLPPNKWMYVVGLSIFQVLKGKKVIYQSGQTEVDPSAKEVQFQLLPTIYISAYQTSLATPELVDKLQSRIIEHIFNFSSEDVGLIAWLFTITPPSMQPKRQNKDLLMTKLQAIVEGGFNKSTFTLKDISMLVWAFCNTGGKSNRVYKQQANFWKNIEFYIQDRIQGRKEERIFNSCCQVMWAYGNNQPLTITTVDLLANLIIDKESTGSLGEEMFVFELTTLTSFFYSLRNSLPPSLTSYLQQLSIKYFGLLIKEMNYMEIMKMLKYTIYDQQQKLNQGKIPLELWETIIDQFIFDVQRIQYSSIMGVVGFAIVSPQGQSTNQKVIDLVRRLMGRKSQLEQLRHHQTAQSN